ncbi:MULTISPECIES: TerD family protein [Moraxella]|uniref:TerD family protein n=1 Tax=Faucicola osloensis TaxID=34062 RepID=UPI0020051F64|nr:MULTISPECIES: TerD family protein [Moraxella]MCK6052125.1 TerD family protein [Moraxella osloensis]
MKHANNNTLEATATDTNTQQPSKLKTTILYSDLTDDSPITSAKSPDNLTPSTTTETYQIISAQFADPAVEIIAPVNSPNLTDKNTNETVVSGTLPLQKAPTINPMTDDKILQKSHQLAITQDDQLEDDKTASGIAVEHMDVVLKQWYFTVQWQKTQMPKSGLYNKFKKRTQAMDIDLSCLLCNRYGEVIETVWFKNVRDKAQSVRHQGDELLGKKPFSAIDDRKEDADNNQSTKVNDANLNQESMVLFLSKLPPQVFHVVMIVSSYHGYALSKAKEASCQLSDDEGNVISELAFTKLPTDTKALWFASLTRFADSWRYNTEHQPLDNNKMALIEKEVSEKLVRTAR